MFAEELERLFWKRSDASKETKKIQELFNSSKGGGVNERKVQSLIINLQDIPSPTQMNLHILQMDGMIHDIPIQSQFFESVSVDGELRASMTTIADVKSKVEEVCGVRAICQMLYARDHEDCFEDYQTIEESGLLHDQTVHLIIDTDRLYWKEHSDLVQAFKTAVVKVYKVMASFKNDHASPDARSRVVKFLKSCRKALAFLLEKSATHKARPMKTLRLVESHLSTVVLPIFNAINSREQQVANIQRQGLG
jgi:hypothetical protein